MLKYNNIFDTHAHYNDKQFDNDRKELLSSLPEKGICGIVNCGTDIKTSLESLAYTFEYPYVYAACGIHPHDCLHESENWESELIAMCQNSNCTAIGEIGLDYHYNFSPKKMQTDFFEKQLSIAKELDKPVIVHDREAHQDTIELLKKYKPKGVVHCFSGSVEMACEVISIGMYIGLGGAVTFNNAKKPIAVAEFVPINRLLLETDCPYMTPVPFRGQRNDSSYISYSAEFISKIKKCDTQKLLDQTAVNARILFSVE